MAEIAPWENPNLPAPFATIERAIEGRTRRFALWRWDERLVWRDLDYPRLWWATLDVAASLADWERAIEDWRFGRAFTHSCDKSLNGNFIRLSSCCRLRLTRDFYVIADKHSGGTAREVKADIWLFFAQTGGAYNRRKNERAPSIWHVDRHFYVISRSLIYAFTPLLLERISPGLQTLIEAGKTSPVLQIMSDLAIWNFYNNALFTDFKRNYAVSHQKIISYFGLPDESIFHVWGERKRINGIQMQFIVRQDYQVWDIETSLLVVTTMHELLELQLRLRDALKPILTPAEIEEILAVPTRP